MRFYEKIPLRGGEKKILLVFLVLGAIWAIFLGPDFLKNPTALADWLFEELEDWSHGAGSFIKGLIGLLLIALIGILWVFLWLWVVRVAFRRISFHRPGKPENRLRQRRVQILPPPAWIQNQGLS